MKITIKHYYDFQQIVAFPSDSLLSSAAWDALRSNGANDGSESFFLPETRQAWLNLCHRFTEPMLQAKDIATLVASEGYTSLASIGVGRACLEYHLKRFCPTLNMLCTDYSLKTVDRLRTVFYECESIECFDLTAINWPRPGSRTLYLLGRVDTELSDSHWSLVFANMAEQDVQDVLVVATSFLTPRVFLSELKRRLACWAAGRRPIFAGYTRTRSRFKDLWSRHYRIRRELPVGNLSGFLLTKIRTTATSACSR